MTRAEFRTLRISLGLSQAALGRIMGIGGNEICRIETTRKPTLVQAAFLRYIAETKTKLEAHHVLESV